VYNLQGEKNACVKKQNPTAAGIKTLMFGLSVEVSKDKCNINNFCCL
jgi:hypothetical protein